MRETLSPHGLLEIFADQIESLGGTVTERIDTGSAAFARSVLPLRTSVAPEDEIRGGVAMRCSEDEVCIHPYTLRQVCSNGAIIAHAVDSLQINNFGLYGEDRAVEEVREAIRCCASPEAFQSAADEMRAARHNPAADYMITMLPMLTRMSGALAGQMLQHIMTHFHAENDRSLFGWMNAITATARDQRDPAMKWRLESLGGGVPAVTKRLVPVRPAAMRVPAEAT